MLILGNTTKECRDSESGSEVYGRNLVKSMGEERRLLKKSQNPKVCSRLTPCGRGRQTVA